MEILQKFSQRLSELHAETDMSQDEAVAVMGRKTGENIHQTTFSNWLRGKKEPTLSNLAALSLMYGVSIDYLAGLSRDKTPPDQLSHRIAETALPGPVQCAAKKLTQLSDVSRDRIMAEIEERFRSEQRWQQIESLVKKMDADGSITSRLLSKLGDLDGSSVLSEPVRELVG